MILKYFWALLFTVSVCVSPLFADKIIDELSVKEQYLAGVVILSRSHSRVSGPLRKRYFEQLQELTGLSEEEGAELLEYYKTHPHKWEKKLKKIETYLAQQMGSDPLVKIEVDSSGSTLKQFFKKKTDEDTDE